MFAACWFLKLAGSTDLLSLIYATIILIKSQRGAVIVSVYNSRIRGDTDDIR